MGSITTPDSGAEILARIIMPEHGRMAPEAAREILEYKLPPDDRERVNALAAKARAGSLTADERTALDEYEGVTSLVEIMQSKGATVVETSRSLAIVTPRTPNWNNLSGGARSSDVSTATSPPLSPCPKSPPDPVTR